MIHFAQIFMFVCVCICILLDSTRIFCLWLVTGLLRSPCISYMTASVCEKENVDLTYRLCFMEIFLQFPWKSQVYNLSEMHENVKTYFQPTFPQILNCIKSNNLFLLIKTRQHPPFSTFSSLLHHVLHIVSDL